MTTQEPADEEYARKVVIRARLEELDQEDEDGNTHRDPVTGAPWMVCVNCDDLMALEDLHSSGECNFCHGMLKDD